MELPVAAARDPEALAAAPLRVRAVVGPLALQRLGLPPETDRDPPRAFKGRLHADVSIDGTLRAPTGVVHVQVDDIRLDKTFVGYAPRRGDVRRPPGQAGRAPDDAERRHAARDRPRRRSTSATPA